jgi:hypothetical protein
VSGSKRFAAAFIFWHSIFSSMRPHVVARPGTVTVSTLPAHAVLLDQNGDEQHDNRDDGEDCKSGGVHGLPCQMMRNPISMRIGMMRICDKIFFKRQVGPDGAMPVSISEYPPQGKARSRLKSAASDH